MTVAVAGKAGGTGTGRAVFAKLLRPLPVLQYPPSYAPYILTRYHSTQYTWGFLRTPDTDGTNTVYWNNLSTGDTTPPNL